MSCPGLHRPSAMARQLRLPDFYGADFDVDEFVGHAIG